MDIGKNIRCYTVEPIRDPVPHQRDASDRSTPPRRPAEQPVASTSHPLPYADVGFALVMTPGLTDRVGE